MSRSSKTTVPSAKKVLKYFPGNGFSNSNANLDFLKIFVSISEILLILQKYKYSALFLNN